MAEPTDALCPAELHDYWDDQRVDLSCEREAGHDGLHSSGQGEWEWNAGWMWERTATGWVSGRG